MSLKKYLEKFKSFFRNKFKNSEIAPELPAEENFAEGIIIGVDPAADRGDETVMELCFYPDGKVTYAPVPVIRFENLPEAKKGFDEFICDRSCNPLPQSDLCFHVFILNCPRCLKDLQFNVEDVELIVGLATAESVCFECWEEREEKRKKAA